MYIYFVHVDEYIGAFRVEDQKIFYAPREKFVDFVLKLRKDNPEHKMKYIINDGVCEAIKKRIEKDKLATKLLNLNNNTKEK